MVRRLATQQDVSWPAWCSGCIWTRPGHLSGSGEYGGAALELAVAFPFLVLMFLAIAAAAWVSWLQGAAAIAGMEAGRAAAYHQGESINPAAAPGSFYAAMRGITSEKSAGWIGLPQVQVDWDRRIVSVRLEHGVSFAAGTVRAGHSLRSGTFTRIQDFFGGAPRDTWE